MEEEKSEVMQTSDWLLTLLISMIPLVNIIMLLVWAFGNKTNPNKANWSKAMLVYTAIIIGIYIIVLLVFGVSALALRA